MEDLEDIDMVFGIFAVKKIFSSIQELLQLCVKYAFNSFVKSRQLIIAQQFAKI